MLRSQWPNLPEARLVELCCEWARERVCRAVVVFDGRAPGGAAGDACDVVGTGAETADEWIERAAAELAERGEPYWLVTSDRALRQAAGRKAGRVIGGGAFLRELQAESPRA